MSERRLSAVERIIQSQNEQLAELKRILNRATQRPAIPAPVLPTGPQWGKANSDWDPFTEIEVTIWTGTPAGTGEETAEVVDCISPGTDGEGMEGVIGLIFVVQGYGPEIRRQFLPLQCEPTPPGSY